jgi:N-acetylneuraminate synthase/N,N'-diacetyllegionaminate synthase
MVKAIRDVESARGNGIKGPNEDEDVIKKVARRSIVARCDIRAGDILKESDLAIKRPGTGIEPRYFGLIVNKKARIRIPKDQVINWDMIE